MWLTHLSFRFFSTEKKSDRRLDISSQKGFNSAQDVINFDKNKRDRNHEKCVRTRKTRVIIA